MQGPTSRRQDRRSRAAVRLGMLSLPLLSLLSLLPLVGGGCSDAPAGRSIVIITLDTVRADHLGSYGYPLPTSPRMDELARRGVLFEAAYAPMPQTLPSHATLFTGHGPRVHGAVENAYVMAEGTRSLAQMLEQRGYETAAFIAARILDDTTGIERGFATFDLPTGVARDKQHPVERRADAVTDSALAWALTRHTKGKPFLLWAHYYDAHGPWEPVAWRIPRDGVREQVERRKEFSALPHESTEDAVGLKDVITMWHGYDNEVAEVDAQVGRLLAGLEQRGMLKDALIVIVGDHGEGLMEHDEKGHGVSVFEELMHVPLIVAAPPGVLPARRVAEPVRMEDLLPTLLDLADLGERPAGLPGLNLAPELRAGGALPVRPVFVERPHYTADGERYRRALSHGWGFGLMAGVIDGTEKLVRYPDDSQQLYDLAADPDELVDHAAQRPEVVERLGRLLDGWLARYPVTDLGSVQDISPERAEILQALGYLGDESGATAPGGEAQDAEAQDGEAKQGG
jgi:arylsulfatase A-like enzyme